VLHHKDVFIQVPMIFFIFGIEDMVTWVTTDWKLCNIRGWFVDFLSFKSQTLHTQTAFMANSIVVTCQQRVRGEQVSLQNLFMQTSVGQFLLFQIVERGILYALLMILVVNHGYTCWQ
jgi:hypothetical protein